MRVISILVFAFFLFTSLSCEKKIANPLLLKYACTSNCTDIEVAGRVRNLSKNKGEITKINSYLRTNLTCFFACRALITEFQTDANGFFSGIIQLDTTEFETNKLVINTAFSDNYFAYATPSFTSSYVLYTHNDSTYKALNFEVYDSGYVSLRLKRSSVKNSDPKVLEYSFRENTGYVNNLNTELPADTTIFIRTASNVPTTFTFTNAKFKQTTIVTAETSKTLSLTINY